MRIYVAGKYTDNHVFKSLNNMRIGIQYSIEVFKMGHVPFCPWLDYLFVLLGEGEIEKDRLYEYSIEWLKVCDAIFLVPGWSKSEGTLKELEVAEELNIPIYLSLNEIPKVEE